MIIVKENKDYRLTRPYNCYDMNYHVLEKATRKEYLIDIGDVYSMEDLNHDGLSEYPDIIWDELKELENMEEILYYAWKVV